jgi:hypothetical protein
MAIILRYVPKLKNQTAGDLSETDLEFLENLIKEDPAGKQASNGEGKDSMINSRSLAVLLEAYQNIDNSFVAELPLELALIKIINKE